MTLIILFIIVIVAIGAYSFIHNTNAPASRKGMPTYNLNEYMKKPFLFDTTAEFHFFSVLEGFVGNDYLVFPQVNYSHLVVPRTGSWNRDRRYRSHIERKSADFVVCDKKTCVPRLVIDLDGEVHRRQYVHVKDVEIDQILKAVGLPILRLSNDEVSNIDTTKVKILAMLK